MEFLYDKHNTSFQWHWFEVISLADKLIEFLCLRIINHKIYFQPNIFALLFFVAKNFTNYSSRPNIKMQIDASLQISPGAHEDSQVWQQFHQC
jgi:hypothetical protein